MATVLGLILLSCSITRD